MGIVSVRRVSQVFFLAWFLWFCLVSSLGEQYWQLRGWPVTSIMSKNLMTSMTRLLAAGSRYSVKVTLSKGRMWVKVGQPFDVTVRSGHALITAQGEVSFEVAQTVDAQAYQVTTVRVYRGQVQVTGENKKSSTQTVASGNSVKVNDNEMFPAKPFAVATADAWEKWNLAYTDSAEPVADAAPEDTAPSAASFSAFPSSAPVANGRPAPLASEPELTPMKLPPVAPNVPHAPAPPVAPPVAARPQQPAPPVPPVPQPNMPSSQSQPQSLPAPVYANPSQNHAQPPAPAQAGAEPGAPPPGLPAPVYASPDTTTAPPAAPPAAHPAPSPQQAQPAAPSYGGGYQYGQPGTGLGPTSLPNKAPPGYND